MEAGGALVGVELIESSADFGAASLGILDFMPPSISPKAAPMDKDPLDCSGLSSSIAAEVSGFIVDPTVKPPVPRPKLEDDFSFLTCCPKGEVVIVGALGSPNNGWPAFAKGLSLEEVFAKGLSVEAGCPNGLSLEEGFPKGLALGAAVWAALAKPPPEEANEPNPPPAPMLAKPDPVVRPPLPIEGCPKSDLPAPNAPVWPKAGLLLPRLPGLPNEIPPLVCGVLEPNPGVVLEPPGV